METDWTKEFVVIGVSRADLVGAGIPRERIEHLTDEQMETIAQSIAVQYADSFFSDDIRGAWLEVIEHREL